MRRFLTWVQSRWRNRRKPARFDKADLERDKVRHMPEGEANYYTGDRYRDPGPF
jgi:hypothetical protein